MSTIEPNDEQRTAATAFCNAYNEVKFTPQGGRIKLVDASTIAVLLAEREAPLQDQVDQLTEAVCALREDLRHATIRLARCHDAKD